MSEKRFGWIDALRGLAMAAIIVGHPNESPETLTSLCYSFHVPLFFMISGALFRPEKYSTLCSCGRKYAHSLLMPYALLYSINIPLWYINWKLIGDSTASGNALLAGVYYANQTIRPMANGALWFLPTLFLTTIACWSLCKLLEDRKGGLCIGIIGCLICACVVRVCGVSTLPWTADAVPACAFFFLLGKALMPRAVRLSESVQKSSSRRRGLIIIGGGCLVLAGLLGASCSLRISGAFVSLMRNELGLVPLGVISAAMISVGLAVLFIVLPSCRALQWFGSNTLGSLAFHIPVMRFIENVIKYKLQLPAQPILVSLLVIALMFPVNRFINRFAPILVGK